MRHGWCDSRKWKENPAYVWFSSAVTDGAREEHPTLTNSNSCNSNFLQFEHGYDSPDNSNSTALTVTISTPEQGQREAYFGIKDGKFADFLRASSDVVT